MSGKFWGMLVVVVLAVAGCADDEVGGHDTGEPTTRPAAGPLPGASMAALDEDTVCGLIPAQTVESTLNVTVDDEVGREYGEPGDALTHNLSCVYGFADGQVDTWLSANVEEKTDDQLVDEFFADAQYEEVPGLGLAAGFGAHPDTGLDQQLLAMVVQAGEGRIAVKLNLNPKDKAGLGELEQLAETLAGNLRQELG